MTATISYLQSAICSLQFQTCIRGGLADVDSLAERHKDLVGDILERRQARLERAQEYFTTYEPYSMTYL